MVPAGVIFVVILILTRFVPFSSFFRNVNTLVHELAHAIAALLLQGSVDGNPSLCEPKGVTLTRFQEGWMMIPSDLRANNASLFSLLLFVLYKQERREGGLSVIALISGLALVLFIRNGYGSVGAPALRSLRRLLLSLRRSGCRRVIICSLHS